MTIKTRLQAAWLRALAQISKRFPEVFLLWGCGSGFLLVSLWVMEHSGEADWIEASSEMVVMWRDFFGWATLLALVYRLFSESKYYRPWSWWKRLPLACQSTMVALIGGLALELATGGVLRRLAGMDVPADLLSWWTSVVWMTRGAMIVILFCSVSFYVLLAKKTRTLGTWSLYLLHHLTLAEISGGVIFIGWLIAVSLLDSLLDWHWFESMLYVFAICGAVGPSFYLLLCLPTPTQDVDRFQAGKFWEVLLTGIGSTLLTLYAVIAYLYVGHSFLARQWPRYGTIHLVLWFAMTTCFWLIVTDYFRERQAKRKLKLWARGLSISLVPLLFLAVVGLGFRVYSFGWTLPRFLVAGGLVWVVVTLWLWWRRQLRWWTLMTATVALLVCLVGPVCVWRSQVKRHGDDWAQGLTTRQWWSESGSIDDEEEKYFGFYGDLDELLTDHYDVSQTQLLLVADEQIEHKLQTSSGQYTYIWLSETEEATEEGMVGQFHLWRGKEEVLSFNVGDYLAGLNQRCQENNEDEYMYGCFEADDLVAAGGGEASPAGLRIKVTGTGVTAEFFLVEWNGHYVPREGKSVLEYLSGLALVSVTGR